MKHIVSMENVIMDLGNKRAPDGVNISVARGEIFTVFAAVFVYAYRKKNIIKK